MPNPSPGSPGYAGAAELPSGTSEFNVIDFIVRQVLSQAATATLVRIEAVTNDGGVAAVGFVDVLPLVAQINGTGEPTPHLTIYNVPYSRLQGGTNAVILDPVVGDIGVCVFADRDISSVKVNKGPSNPGSRRQFSMADAIYLGGVLNGEPVQYVRFAADGIHVVSPTKVFVEAPDIELDGDTTVTGALHVQGAVTGDGAATFDGEVTGNDIELSTHTHSGVTTGGGTSGPPTP